VGGEGEGEGDGVTAVADEVLVEWRLLFNIHTFLYIFNRSFLW
jgi:hypothetical protein